MRPTVLFCLALSITIAWVAFSVWVSTPWRGDLEAALGPILGWAIPICLAYIPGLVVMFMMATLVLSPYRPPALDLPLGEAVAGRDRGCSRLE